MYMYVLHCFILAGIWHCKEVCGYSRSVYMYMYMYEVLRVHIHVYISAMKACCIIE